MTVRDMRGREPSRDTLSTDMPFRASDPSIGPVTLPGGPPASPATSADHATELDDHELLEDTGASHRADQALESTMSRPNEDEIVIADDLAEIVDEGSSPKPLLDTSDQTQRGSIPPMKQS